MLTDCVTPAAFCVRLKLSAGGMTAAEGPEDGVTMNVTGLGLEVLKIVIPSMPIARLMVTVALNCPGVVSVPLNTPFGVRVKPGGKLPPVTAKLKLKKMPSTPPSDAMASASGAYTSPKS